MTKQQLLNPDWDFYERHLQRRAPEALRALYEEHALLTDGDLALDKKHRISCFNPIQEASLLDTAEELGFDIVPFATSDCGDAIFLRPGRTESDKVYLAYHDDPANVQVVAGSVAEMLTKVRSANPRTSKDPDSDAP